MTVIPVIIGDEVNKEHVKPVTDDEDRIVPVQPTDRPEEVTVVIVVQIDEAIKSTYPHTFLEFYRCACSTSALCYSVIHLFK